MVLALLRMDQSFVAQTLNSKQLLALLFVCERTRKNRPLSKADLTSQVPSDWLEMLELFSTRLATLGETVRFEVLEAHLMSVEDIDIYNNQTLTDLLKNHSDILGLLTTELDNDPRFRLSS